MFIAIVDGFAMLASLWRKHLGLLKGGFGRAS